MEDLPDDLIRAIITEGRKVEEVRDSAELSLKNPERIEILVQKGSSPFFSSAAPQLKKEEEEETLP